MLRFIKRLRFASMRTWEYRDSMARETCPAMLMMTSSPAPDSASSVSSVCRLSCHRPTTYGFVQAGSAARLPASVFDLPTVSVFFSRRSICCQRSWRSSLSRSPQFRSRTSAGFCCAASWPPPTCAPSSACARDPAKAAYSASTTFPDASSRGSVRPGLHRAGAAIALRR